MCISEVTAKESLNLISPQALFDKQKERHRSSSFSKDMQLFRGLPKRICMRKLASKESWNITFQRLLSLENNMSGIAALASPNILNLQSKITRFCMKRDGEKFKNMYSQRGSKISHWISPHLRLLSVVYKKIDIEAHASLRISNLQSKTYLLELQLIVGWGAKFHLPPSMREDQVYLPACMREGHVSSPGFYERGSSVQSMLEVS